MTGLIFDIQRFSTHDGPGIRSVVFFKGCPLRCAWCENPESQEAEPELLFDPKHCIDCAACLQPGKDGPMGRDESGRIAVLHRRAVNAINLEVLAENCPSLAIRIAGRRATADDIVAEVMRDEAFFRKSGGGVTFSGGEPLLQAGLLRELLAAFATLGIHCAVESCLAVTRTALDSILPYNPTWLADLKHIDPVAFRNGTGGDLRLVLGNLEHLAECGADLILRVPVIPHFNDDEASLRGILEYAATLPKPEGRRLRVDLLPYHDLAAGKYTALGRSYPYPRSLAINNTTLCRQAELGQDLGLDIFIGG